ncbi:MAG: GNAT family N-acetyltransferase [Hyphomicrobiaceae bacterium]
MVCIDMDIRRATLEDAEAACGVIRRSIADLCELDHHGDPTTIERWLANKTPENVATWIGAAGNIVLVAIDGGAILGVAAMTSIGHVTLNYVSPDHRFRGVSKALLESLEGEAIKLGLRQLSLHSTKTARRFYRAAGFVEKPDATRPDDIYMVKTIGVSP